ncbi:MAG: beta-N-acetylglucosaminidase domain-containing protein [bacterium]
MKKTAALITAAVAAWLSSCGFAYVLMPSPQKLVEGEGVVRINPGAVFVSSGVKDHDRRAVRALTELFPGAGFTDKPVSALPAGSALIVSSIAEDLPEATGGGVPAGLSERQYAQSYSLRVKPEGEGRVLVEITAAAPMGEFYALKTLKQLAAGAGEFPSVTIHDYPVFEGRGILEGFYGEPWEGEKRKAMIRWMADYKFNHYLYAPKDDPKLRFSWRMSYSEKELDEIGALAELARENFVDYCTSISPGISINFSREKDFELIVRKMKSVLDRGVNCVALAFDDVNPVLTPLDRGKFKTYWEGQVKFANRFIEAILEHKPGAEVGFVPNDYWGELCETSESLRYTGRHLDPRYTIGWTGNKIIPETVTPSDARYYEFFIRRTPILGDNYPVTDSVSTAGGRISLGPLRGRDPRLHKFISGYTANAMPLPYTSKPAYVTIADYTWNPYGYEPERAAADAWKALAGEARYEPFLFFSEQNASSFIWDHEAVELSEAARAFWMAYDGEFDYDFAEAEAALMKILRRFSTIGAELERAANPETAGIIEEMKPWIDKLTAYGRAGLIAAEQLSARFHGRNVDGGKLAELETLYAEAEKSKAVVTKTIMTNFLNRSVAALKDQPVPEEIPFRTIMTQD